MEDNILVGANVIYRYAVSGNGMSSFVCYFIAAYSRFGLGIVKLEELLN